jgi:hypothetical protein
LKRISLLRIVGNSHQLGTSIYVLTLVAVVFAFVIVQLVIFFWIRSRDTKAHGQIGRCSSAVSSDPAIGSSGQIMLLPMMIHNKKLLLWPMHMSILLNMLGHLGSRQHEGVGDISSV